MNEKKWAALLFGAVIVAGGTYYWFNRPAPAVVAPAPAPVAEVPPPAPAPPPDYAVPPPPPETPPLPTLADSDAAFKSGVIGVVGAAPFEAFVVPDMLIRRIVVTVDNLGRDRVAMALRPLKKAPGSFAVRQDGASLAVAPDNAARYDAQVALFTAVDAGQLVALYYRYYPLFQKAYIDLGYPGKSFNNRLVEVIDLLLATPPTPVAIELTHLKVVYEFADPALEAAPAGQKMLLRLDPTQRAATVAQLKKIRLLLAAHAITH